MKNQITIAYFCAVALGVFGIAATVHTICSKISAIHYISYAYDPQLSMSLRKAIERQVALLEYDGYYQPRAIMQELLRLFPDIQQIDIRSLPYNMAEIIITAPDPVVIINSSHILTQNRTVLPSDFYAEYVHAYLPQIEIDVIPEVISKEVMGAIKHSIEERIFDHFVISLHGDQEWYLYDKKDPLFAICCNGESLPTGKVRQACDRLKETIKKKYSPKTAWMANVRFGHQIVLSRYKRGRNGKRI